jgi:ribosomal protein L37AE/L43A
MGDLNEYIKKNLDNSAFLCCEHCGKEQWVLIERVNKSRIIWVCRECSDKYPNDGTIAHIPDHIYLD